MTESSSTLEIKSVTEQEIFKNPINQSFIREWFRINDKIEPVFISDRDEWEQKESILEKDQNSDKKFLYLPEDLQLYEMVKISEIIERDTFKDNPEKQKQLREEFCKFGHIFKNSAIYIAQRLSYITQGQEIAKNVVEEFYNYGQSLIDGKKSKDIRDITDISPLTLNSQQTEETERFLAGENLYQSRKTKAEAETLLHPKEKEDIYEQQRIQTLKDVFKILDLAFKLRQNSLEGKLKSVKTGKFSTHAALIKKINESIKQKMERPESQIYDSVFRRGMEILQTYMPSDNIPAAIKDISSFWNKNERTIRQGFNVNKYKSDLELIRQSSLSQASKSEKIITSMLQTIISSLPRKKSSNNPSEIITRQEINCLGASMLGGSLMQEMGINYLVVSTPGHSVLLLITSDGDVEWRDMLNISNNHKLTDQEINGKDENGQPIKIIDIVAFSKNPNLKNLTINIVDNKKFNLTEEDRENQLVILKPVDGQKAQLLFNLARELVEQGIFYGALKALNEAKKISSEDARIHFQIAVVHQMINIKSQEAIEEYQQAKKLDPKNSLAYFGLGGIFNRLGKYQEAIEEYQQAKKLDPKNSQFYFDLGGIFNRLGKSREAIEEYQQAKKLDPKNEKIYLNLGLLFITLKQSGNAIKELETFINLAEYKKYDETIKHVKEILSIIKFGYV
jgi:tetratricopeptide (TPR) repeat protein